MIEIGSWMEKFPAHFLDDLYLKYIGWTLHDKVPINTIFDIQADQIKALDELRSILFTLYQIPHFKPSVAATNVFGSALMLVIVIFYE